MSTVRQTLDSSDPAASTRSRPAASAALAGAIVCAHELAHLVDFGLVRLVDVREPDEFQARRIAGSVNVPIGRLEQSPATLAADVPVVLCSQKGERSARALALLQAAGRRRIQHLHGGMEAWVGEGLHLMGDALHHRRALR